MDDVSTENIDSLQIFIYLSVAGSILSWVYLAVYILKSIRLRCLPLFSMAIVNLLNGICFSIMLFVVLMITYGYYEGRSAYDKIIYLDATVQSIITAQYFCFLFSSLAVTSLVIYCLQINVIAAAIFLSISVNYQVKKMLIMIQILQTTILIVALILFIKQRFLISGKNKAQQVNYFQDFNNVQEYNNQPCQKQHLLGLNDDLFKPVNRIALPRFECINVKLVFQVVIIVVLQIINFIGQVLLQQRMNVSVNAIMYFEAQTDIIQQAYAEVEVAKQLFLIDIFWVFIPVGFIIIAVADINSFLVMVHNPTIIDVFRNKQLMQIFVQWLFENKMGKYLEFLIDTMLLVQKYPTDSTSANVIFLKYKDLNKHGQIYISKHAFAKFEQALNSDEAVGVRLNAEESFLQSDENKSEVDTKLNQRPHNSQDQTNYQTLGSEHSSSSSSSNFLKKQLHEMLFCAQLEISLQLIYMANVFLQKDESFLKNVFIHSQFHNNVKKLYAGYSKYELSHANAGKSARMQIIKQKQREEKEQLNYYLDVLENFRAFLPQQYTYDTDSNILICAMKVEEAYNIRRQLQKLQYNDSHLYPATIIDYDQPIYKHIQVFNEVTDLFVHYQNKLINQRLKTQIGVFMDQLIQTTHVRFKEPATQITITTEQLLQFQRNLSTYMFNDPQFYHTTNLNDVSNIYGVSVKDESVTEKECSDTEDSFEQNKIKAEIKANTRDYVPASQQNQKFLDFHEQIKETLSDQYPKQIRLPVFVQEIDVNSRNYQFDQNGQCQLTKQQQTIKDQFKVIADSLMLNDLSAELDEQMSQYPEDVKKLSDYLNLHFRKDSFDARVAEELTDGHGLLLIVYLTLCHINIDDLQIPENTLFAFLYELELGYSSTYYHNRLHICDFVQMTYLQIIAVEQCFQVNSRNNSFSISYEAHQDTGALKIFTSIDKFALVMAAACHDFGHTGVDNVFCVNSKSILYYMYPNVGPMEQAHAQLSWTLLLKFSNIFTKFEPVQFREFRIKFIELILTTDMGLHKHFVQCLQELEQASFIEYFTSPRLGINEHQVNQWLLMKLIIKFSDIANPCRPFSVAEFWACCFNNENRVLGDYMHKCGLPLNDVNKKDTDFIAQSQIGFINFILRPFLTLVSNLFSELNFKFYTALLNTMETNMTKWQAIKAESQQ